eukprot:TRINITY_DN3528_c0_g1_i2.p1 TRINITY_DN3528_c0_g1~~TRINITY_DN3528_c0_g1_i2.p1  ORF type:complete len:184 (-),score=36.90 TRINITY_DN3528_c0_g1_i2:105-656(-)
MSKNILQSLLLDTAPFKWAELTNWQAWKEWKDGKQPEGSVPSFPEEEQSETEKLPTEALNQLVKELNKIFYDTAFYPARFFWISSLISIILHVIPIFLPLAALYWIGVIVLGTFFMRHERKKRKALENTLQEWNNSTGVDYGVHFEMGGRDGAGPNCCGCYKEVFLHVCDGPGEDIKLSCLLI